MPLLAQLAALSPEHRALLAKLLSPPTAATDPRVGLDDTLPRGFEGPKGETG